MTKPSETYLTDPNHCPSCGHEDTEGGPVEIDNGSATQEMVCWNCGAAWTDGYRLTSFTMEDNSRSQQDL